MCFRFVIVLYIDTRWLDFSKHAWLRSFACHLGGRGTFTEWPQSTAERIKGDRAQSSIGKISQSISSKVEQSEGCCFAHAT
jgi:hypothetical protein